MNNERRKSLRQAKDLLDKAYNIICDALDEEQDCLDNMPENLQDSERYEMMENAVDELIEASESLDYVRENVERACE